MSCPSPILLLLLVAFQSNAAVADDGPAKDVPELQALSEYVGKWDLAEDSPLKVKGESTAEWILDGRFVQRTGILKKEDGTPHAKSIALMTFDSREKKYRMWTYTSQGLVTESSGTWDATKRTMTWVFRPDKATLTTTATFGENGSEQWTVIGTNEKNEVLSKFGGTNIRRKE